MFNKKRHIMDDLTMRLLNHARALHHSYQQRFWRTVELLSSSVMVADHLPHSVESVPVIINPSPTLVSYECALQLHWEGIMRYGGERGGVRGKEGEHQLRSALESPLCGYFRTLEEQSMSIFEKITLFHPFSDGNKRAAYMVTHRFLDIHGYIWVAEPLEVHRLSLSLCNHQISLEQVVSFITASVERI